MGFICSSIKMAVMVLSLLLLLQLPLIFASGLLNTKACGTYHVTYSERSGHELFYLNKKLVNRDLFCKAINVYNTRHCFIPRNVRSHCCEVDRFSDGLLVKAGRRLLRNVVREETQGEQKSEGEKTKDDQESLLTPRSLSVAVPGFFLLCCAFLCPCFRARKKETGHNVLSKDQSPMDSVSSLEMNSVSEKVPPASPMRAPASPMRVPASPMRVPPSPSRFSMSPKLNRVGSVHLNMSQVARATQNFSPSLRLGEGGFGTVYKANLQDGQVVAIKRAKKEHFEALQTEFRSEVEVLAKIDHRNLVKLLGYVERGNERLLITEYVPNGTLREHLDGAHGSYLDFNQRLEISIDVAHALTYLHMYAEKQIIHRDVKSSNILLTENLRAKVADFGFAKSDDLDNDKTHVSTKVRGTIGYLDPEYMRTYQLTPKSDVYSFGVLLIEIITGRRPVEMKRPPEERVTIRWAFKRYNEGRVMDLVDPQMNESVNQEILHKMLGLAIQCAAPTRADRPEMKSVGEQLWLIRMDYMKSARAT